MGKVVVPKEVSERGKAKEETQAPNTMAQAAEAPKTEAPAKEATVKEVPAKETPKTEAPKTEAHKAEAPETAERAVRTERTDRPTRQSRDVQNRDGQNREGRSDRQGRGDRPQRQNRDGQQERRGQGSRDSQSGRGDQGGRTQRQSSDNRGDRTQRRDRNDAPKFDRIETKPNQKNTEKRDHHEKERNKFAKLEGGSSTGKKNKERMQQRSLEKAAKPKKHNKPKPAVVEEEDIMEELPTGTIAVTVPITVAGFCEQAGISTSQVIMALMKMGIMANINQNIDEDTVLILADELGISVVVAKVEEEMEEEGLELFEDREEDLKPRAPIITVMGHVDHGKTSLLDYIRKSNVIAGEAGGITQHIGAYNVKLPDGRRITFLDTPGHEAFTAMRARGAQLTDLAIIIIAADDAVMPQTVEAINHAQAAGVPMVFAINKIDKPGAQPEKIYQQLAQMNILTEAWGGKYQSQEISAKKGLNVDKLLEKVLLETDLLDLKANPDKNAVGAVIESSLDKGRGYLATVLVQDGTLHTGDMMLSGCYYGRVKAMFNERGQKVKEAGPSTPVSVLGLNGAPSAGDKFNVMSDEKEAKAIANKREQLIRIQGIKTQKHMTLEEIGRRIAIGNFKELNVIVKGDVDGSVEALSDSLIKLSTEQVRVNVIHKAVGAISESDVILAEASDAVIIGFQVRPSTDARKIADEQGIEIRIYSVIYDAINDVKDGIEGMLEPIKKEEITGTAEVKQTFKISKVGTIAGCLVRDGKISKTAQCRLIRDGIVVYTGELASLKRGKDDVKEVSAGMECGIGIEKFNDLKVGDNIEAFVITEIKQKLD